MLPKFAAPALILALAGFVLYLLVTLSPPHISDIYLFAIKDDATGSEIRLGAYGLCYALSAGAVTGTRLPATDCIELGLGYQIVSLGSVSSSTTRIPRNAPSIVSPDLTRGLAMNPVTVTFAGICMIWVAVAMFSKGERVAKSSVGVFVLTTIFAWVAFAIDVALPTIARNRIRIVQGASGVIGNAPWLAFGGAIALTAGSILTGIGAFSRQAVQARKAESHQTAMRSVNA